MPRQEKSDFAIKDRTKSKTRKKLQEPKLYKVVLHNDDYTTMEFVVQVLVSVFHKPAADATRIMLDVHKKGRGTCGFYTYDIAMTKVNQVRILAVRQSFPLRCTIEEN